MTQRIIVALIVLPPVLLALWYGGLWWVGLVALAATLGGYEYFTLMQAQGLRPSLPLGLGWLLLLLFSYWHPDRLPLSPVLTAGFIVTLVYSLFQTVQPLANWTVTTAGSLYLGIMLGQALALRLLPDGLWWVFLALLVTFLNDTFAYFVGIGVGRHKIWPRLSPKKSWEGTIGGWVFATLAGAGAAFFTPLPLSPGTGAAIGLVGGVLALLGDLAISMLKRQVGVKDSGQLMPGHGGMLDRLDSLLFVLPFVYQVALLAG